MSYSNNPLLPKARAAAVRLVVEDKLPLVVAARKSGIHRVTLWRWYKQWLELNHNVQFTNDNRPSRTTGSIFRLSSCRWLLPTRSSRPKTFGRALPQVAIDRIQYYRKKYGRCATITHAYCLQEGTLVSLSTVRRVLYRLGLVVRKKYYRYRPQTPRPVVMQPGDLVQTDTIHLTEYRTKRKTYLYTLVDVYSRWAYAEYHTSISQERSAAFLKRGEAYAGFHFQTVQADNGTEFGRWLRDCLEARGTTLRHSRVRKPNDNAFIERFNRTIQEECVGSTNPFSEALYGKVLTYLAYYNQERLHLGLQCQTPSSMLQR